SVFGRRIIGAAVAIAASAFVFSGSASAALQAKTFVSPGTGSDANDCSRHAPCLTLQRALNQVVDHGTVTVLDSGLLGTAATISKPVLITVPRGVEASLSRATGTVLRVTAPASAIVTINGLSIDGHGTADTAIAYSSGAALYLSRVSITDFAPGSSYGIYAATLAVSTHLKLSVADSFISG